MNAASIMVWTLLEFISIALFVIATMLGADIISGIVS